jgi:hypothetical protein
MHQPKRVVHLVQRFSMPQKQVSAGQQIGEEMLHHSALRSQIEINQHIAAENNIDTLLENHLAVVTEIQTIKTDLRFEQVVSLQFLVAHVIEVFAAEYCIGIAQRILAVDACACRFQRIVIKVGGKDIEGPSCKQFGFFFQKKDGESMRLLARRTSRAPEAKPLQPDAPRRPDAMPSSDGPAATTARAGGRPARHEWFQSPWSIDLHPVPRAPAG